MQRKEYTAPVADVYKLDVEEFCLSTPGIDDMGSGDNDGGDAW